MRGAQPRYWFTSKETAVLPLGAPRAMGPGASVRLLRGQRIRAGESVGRMGSNTLGNPGLCRCASVATTVKAG